MIALFAACSVFAPARVVELVKPQATSISIQALVTVPQLGAKDWAKLDILGRTIVKQTQAYPRREMLMVTNGAPVRFDMSPDHVRLAVTVPPGSLKAGLILMESLLRDASLNQDAIDTATQEISAPDYWTAALDPVARPNVHLTSDEAHTLYGRVFRPENILLAVGGKFAPGDAESIWASRMEGWQVEALPRGYFDNSQPTYLTQSPGLVTTIDLAFPPIASGDAALSAKILSLFALGVGKGSSLFQVIREKHAWSYRQEAVLSPSKDGWIPRLMIASIPFAEPKERAKMIQAELLDDVKAWTEATRKRAIGMAEAVFTHQVPFSPFYVHGKSGISDSLEDQTYMAAYWPMKTGQPWNPQALLESMRNVSLDELKEQATNQLSVEIPNILPGS